MDRTLLREVWGRARSRCEYCLVHQDAEDLSLQVDHVFATYHGGPTSTGNLALACFACNHFKGTNIAGLDPTTRRVVRLFHPRRHRWSRHFRWDGPVLVGRTDIGRTTIATLRINAFERIAQRLELIDAGVFPPDG